jgi:hypothetical protein
MSNQQGIPSNTLQSLLRRIRPMCDNNKLYDDFKRLYVQRERGGLSKYHCTVDRHDLMPEEWIDHGLEELLDAMLYFERAGLVELIPDIFQAYLLAKYKKFEILRGKT